MERIKEITEDFKNMDFSSFDEFYDSTSKLVYFVISEIVKRKEIAEELMQETYLKFIQNINTLKSNYNPKAYLVTIARNLAINEYNKSKRMIYNEEILDIIPEDKITYNVDLGIINYLEGIEQEIVTMHIVGDLKFREIAKILDKPLGTVLWVYNKAIKKLKKKVGENDEK